MNNKSKALSHLVQAVDVFAVQSMNPDDYGTLTELLQSLVKHYER